MRKQPRARQGSRGRWPTEYDKRLGLALRGAGTSYESKSRWQTCRTSTPCGCASGSRQPRTPSSSSRSPRQVSRRHPRCDHVLTSPHTRPCRGHCIPASCRLRPIRGGGQRRVVARPAAARAGVALRAAGGRRRRRPGGRRVGGGRAAAAVPAVAVHARRGRGRGGDPHRCAPARRARGLAVSLAPGRCARRHLWSFWWGACLWGGVRGHRQEAGSPPWRCAGDNACTRGSLRNRSDARCCLLHIMSRVACRQGGAAGLQPGRAARHQLPQGLLRGAGAQQLHALPGHHPQALHALHLPTRSRCEALLCACGIGICMGTSVGPEPSFCCGCLLCAARQSGAAAQQNVAAMGRPRAGAPSVGEAVLGPEGESVGTVQGAEGGYGLAYVRLRPALLAAGGEGAAPLSGKQRGAALRPFRPPWWPEAWGHEEDAAGAGAEASPAAEGVPAAAPS